MVQTAQNFSLAFRRLLEIRNLRKDSEIESFLFSGLESLHDPFLMKNMREVKARLEKAVETKEKIFLHGDYDVDGITGVALMVQTLERLGGIVTTFLPERERDGYGVSETAIRKAYHDGAGLIVTVDCGITAKREIEIAKSLGLDVVVIDHHRLPPEGLPDTHLILNPLQPDCPYPFKELSAAGLAFKLSQALLGEQAFKFLDLVTLSTISDIAPLTGENRILVRRGLEMLSGKKSAGLTALAEIAKMKTTKVDTGHVGFILGPRLNAAGRMSSPDTALRLLLTEEPREAESLAKILNEENKVRQQYEREITRSAIQKVERTVNFNRERVLVVDGKDWHVGVIGIVASRLVEKFSRPAIVIAIAEGMGRGSGRSMKGFHLFQALQNCESLLEEFGGHEQAAGLTIREENISFLREKINAFASENLSPELLTRYVKVDMDLKLGELTNHFLEELELLEPYGVGNPRPVFRSEGIQLRSKPRRLYGETYEIVMTDGFLNYQAQINESQMLLCTGSRPGTNFQAAYGVKTKQWNGMKTLILSVKELKENAA
ncbi:MAG TPA: single-stranded-DNA-specific exonuclease RecJ [Candidatus Omnitrophota bacterium]|nr:single-stranded-DNA-specific exonuclease RecJ [Candidatus Omnitrophota bacterium]